MSDAYAELDALPTEELRRRAFATAERRLDLGFFLDLARHLQPSVEAAQEDGSAGAIAETITDAVNLVRELVGSGGFGQAEPLVRARFIDYLVTHR